MDRATLAALIGSAVGATAGGIGGFALSDKKKGNRVRNAILAALAGGAAGAYAGRAGHAHLDFMKRRSAATKLPAGQSAVPGKVYFVDYPDNAIDVSQTGISHIDTLASRLKRLTGWNGKHRIGHAGILTVDSAGNGVRYDYGLYGSGAAKPEVLTQKFNLKGLDDAGIAKAMQWDGWGGKVGLYGTPVKDIGVVKRYMEGLTAPGSKAGFDVVPGGFTCSTAARNAFEAARGGVTGHLLDLLWGGYPTANAPTYGTTHTHFSKEGESVVKTAAGVMLTGKPILGDVLSNTWDAVRSGQFPIPGVTVGAPRKNVPVTAKPGEPVYIAMSGADPWKFSQLSDGLFFRSPGGTNNNNQVAYRWFDRAQAVRDGVRYARAGHPVRLVGESYGGAAAADVAKRMVEHGVRPDMLVMYDPVARGTVTAPTNLAHQAVNIQPQYKNKWGHDNVIARIGGRNPTVAGAKTVPWYGGNPEYFGPTNTIATHYESRYPLKKTVTDIDAADDKARAEQAPVVAKPERPQSVQVTAVNPFSSRVSEILRKGTN